MAKYKASDFIEQIPGSGGIITTIAERVGCSWNTAKKYITEYATVQQAYQDECERVTDMAVQTVLKSIRDGNTQDAKWWLARKRHREFGDRLKQEITGDIGIKGYAKVDPDDWDSDSDI